MQDRSPASAAFSSLRRGRRGSRLGRLSRRPPPWTPAFRGHGDAGSCNRPENRPQNLENVESAPGISTVDRRNFPAVARVDRDRPERLRLAFLVGHRDATGYGRSENRSQSLENIESAPGIRRGDRRNVPAVARVDGDRPERLRLASLVGHRDATGYGRPENRPQSLENIESAPGNSGGDRRNVPAVARVDRDRPERPWPASLVGHGEAAGHGRPENPAQSLENIESAPGNSTGRPPKLPGRRRDQGAGRAAGNVQAPLRRSARGR